MLAAMRHAFAIPMRPALATPLAAATLAMAALAGCGSTSPGGTDASPASVTPATAPLYLEAVVKPEGTLKSDTSADAHTLTGRQHPFEGLLELLAGPTGKAPNYAKEVEPWLGTHAGAFISGVSLAHAQGLLGGETLTKVLSEGLSGLEAALLGQGGLQALLGASSAQGALVLDTSDVEKAKQFLEGQARGAGAHTTSYRGVTYQVSSDGVAEGVVHKFAVIGSEAGMKSVIETATGGGAALAHSGGYGKLTSTAESGALANAYLSPEQLAGATGHSGGSGGGGGAESILPLLEGMLGNPGQLYLSAIPGPHQLALDLDTLPASSGATSGGGKSGSSAGGVLGEGGAQVVGGLPGNSWLALGIGDLGAALGHGARGLSTTIGGLTSALDIGGIDFGKLLAPLHSRSLEVQRDLLSWAGATGVYVSGTSVLELQAALVIDSKNPSASRAAVGEFAQAYREAGGQTSPTRVPGTETAVIVRLPNFPLQLTVAAGQGKFVAGLGSSSIKEALSPQTTLGASPTYTAAESALGHGIKPSAIVEFHTITGLLESLGLNQAPGFSGFASSIAPLGTVTAGGGASLGEGVTRARVVIQLQSSGSATSGEAGG